MELEISQDGLNARRGMDTSLTEAAGNCLSIAITGGHLSRNALNILHFHPNILFVFGIIRIYLCLKKLTVLPPSWSSIMSGYHSFKMYDKNKFVEVFLFLFIFLAQNNIYTKIFLHCAVFTLMKFVFHFEFILTFLLSFDIQG